MMWELINTFIPALSNTLINLAELGAILLTGFGIVKFIKWTIAELSEKTAK
jgi:hypothetical protein